MSEEQVVGFLEKVAEDEALRKKSSQILQRDQPPADSAAAVVALAREHGVEFRAEEFVKIHEAIVAANDGELSEDELAQAAGGASYTCISSEMLLSRDQLIRFGKLAYHCVACSHR